MADDTESRGRGKGRTCVEDSLDVKKPTSYTPGLFATSSASYLLGHPRDKEGDKEGDGEARASFS